MPLLRRDRRVVPRAPTRWSPRRRARLDRVLPLPAIQQRGKGRRRREPDERLQELRVGPFMAARLVGIEPARHEEHEQRLPRFPEQVVHPIREEEEDRGGRIESASLVLMRAERFERGPVGRAGRVPQPLGSG